MSAKLGVLPLLECLSGANEAPRGPTIGVPVCDDRGCCAGAGEGHGLLELQELRSWHGFEAALSDKLVPQCRVALTGKVALRGCCRTCKDGYLSIHLDCRGLVAEPVASEDQLQMRCRPLLSLLARRCRGSDASLGPEEVEAYHRQNHLHLGYEDLHVRNVALGEGLASGLVAVGEVGSVSTLRQFHETVLKVADVGLG